MDPASMPILRRGEWVWLTDSGEVLPCGEEIADWIGGVA
jgi:hypothetical protein